MLDFLALHDYNIDVAERCGAARAACVEWKVSSAGRALALQARGHRFEPCTFHQHLARWCSRLARQPVTLEVDGSSPFRVANEKKAIQKDGFLFVNPEKNDSKDSYYFLIKILILIRKASPEGAACFVIYKERNHKTSLI